MSVTVDSDLPEQHPDFIAPTKELTIAEIAALMPWSGEFIAQPSLEADNYCYLRRSSLTDALLELIERIDKSTNLRLYVPSLYFKQLQEEMDLEYLPLTDFSFTFWTEAGLMVRVVEAPRGAGTNIMQLESHPQTFDLRRYRLWIDW